MPQGRGKNKRKSKPKPPQQNGILVEVSGNKEGRRLAVSTLGNIRQTEVPTLLKLAAKTAENQLGVE